MTKKEISHCPICGKESHLCRCPTINRGSFAEFVDKKDKIREGIILEVPDGYEQIVDNQTSDNTTVARINSNGNMDYLRCVPKWSPLI